MGAKAKKRRVTRPKPRCMNPDCRSRGERRQQYIRGLCEACDKALRRLIAAGKTTWEEAEEEGRCLPKQKRRGSSVRFPDLARRQNSLHAV